MLCEHGPAILIILAGLIALFLAPARWVSWLLMAEVCWLGLYVLNATLSVKLDSLALAVICLVILCVATAESAVGIAIAIYMNSLGHKVDSIGKHPLNQNQLQQTPRNKWN
jgi:NADH:ubiquinone oxidoreductase subunit K